MKNNGIELNKNFVSIIILGFNGRKYIDNCLTSVFSQDFKEDFEVIWVDNNSNDDSVSYIRSNYAKVRVLELDKNYGFAVGNNKATKFANGKYLVYLNQDTIVHNNWLEGLVTVMESNPELGACQSNMFMPWKNGFDRFEKEKIPSDLHYTDLSQYGFVEYNSEKMQDISFKYTSFITGASFIIRRKIVDELEFLFNPLFNTYSEDLELSLRLMRKGYRLAVSTKSVVYHLQYTSVSNLFNALKKAFLSNRNRFWAYRINLTRKEFLLFLPKLMLGAPAKVKEFGWNKVKTFWFSILIIPIAFIGYFAAIVCDLKYRKSLFEMVNYD